MIRKKSKMVEKPTYEELEKKVKELEGTLKLNNITKKDLNTKYSLESKLINSSVDGIIGVDKEGNIFLFNKGAEETLGYSIQDVIGKMNIEKLYLPGMARDVNKKLWSQEFGGYGRIKEYETEILHKNGNYIPVSISGSLLYEKGKAIGSVGYFHDITSKKQVMEKLRESEDKYRTILEGIEDAYYEVDLNGSFTFFNDSLCKILGYSRNELTGKTNRDVMGEDEFRRLFKVTKKIYETKTPETIADWEIIRKDGGKREIEGSISLIENSQARITGFRGIMKDVTDRNKALAEISTLATLVKQANESIVVTDLNGDIVYANPFFEKATGYTVKEALGQNPRVLKSGLQNDSFYKELWDTISSGGIWRGVFINKRKDGSLYHEDASIFPIVDSSEKIVNYAAVKKDITKQVKYEEALKKAKLDAESASIAKSRFLATMSHEIRTPMNGVIGFTDMLLDTGLNEDQIDYAKTIKRSGEALLSLINDVLDFSKIEAGQMDLESISFDPEVTAYDVCELIRPRIVNRPIEILCRIADNLPSYIKGDPGRYRQVLVNIMGNSTKFIESGEIELSLNIEKEKDNQIMLHTTIRDTGIGIAEDKLESIFNPFEQADGSTTRKYGGTGLG
ncbi:MAG: PAS domain S-box protein, partial [Thermodesulfobacteriota bacterium]|nr:PAS domain S-box protein [Thermodesulfobacteriota bacterium]